MGWKPLKTGPPVWYNACHLSHGSVFERVVEALEYRHDVCHKTALYQVWAGLKVWASLKVGTSGQA